MAKIGDSTSHERELSMTAQTYNTSFASLLLNAKIIDSKAPFLQLGQENALGHAETALDSTFVPFHTFAIAADGHVITIRAAEASGQLFIKWVHVRPDPTVRSLEIGIKQEGQDF